MTTDLSKENKKLTYSLVISAFNEEKYLPACLDSIRTYAKDQFKEIIVVDNNSTDGTGEIARAYSEVKVIFEEKKGVTRARQRGFIESTGDVVAFIDADTFIDAAWLPHIDAEFSSNPKLACLSGPMIYHDLTPFNKMISWMYWRIIGIPAYLLGGHIAMGGNMILRREVLEQMNGFDTGIEFYGDDTDTARRAAQFGKSKFDVGLIIYASGRRFKKQGIFSTGFTYTLNFLSQTFFHKSATTKYEDFR